MKKIFLLIVFTIISGKTFAQVTNGLVAKYSFDNGNANDEAGSHNGTVHGANLTTDRFGCPNKAYNFNALDTDYIIVPNNPAIDFKNSDNFTIAFWIKVGAGNGASTPIVKHIPGMWDGFMFLSNTTDHGYCYGQGKFSFYTASGATQDACADSLVSDDTTHWNFITGIYNGSLDRNYIYVNGKLQSDSGKSSGTLSNTADLYFGGRPLTPYASPYTGKLDDIRIYNRALNQLEIDTLYHLQQCSCALLNAGPDVAVCNGQSTILNATGGNPLNYSWSPSTGLSNTNSANPLANPTITTQYILRDTGACAPKPDTVEITVLPSVQLKPIGDTTICTGQSVFLNPSGLTSFSYSWGPAINISCINCANPSVNPSTNVTYTVIAGNGVCSDTVQIKVNMGGSATAGIITAVRDTLCAGTHGNLVLTGNSSNTIQWESSTSQGNFADINGVIDTTLYQTDPLAQTTYYRVIVGSGSCIDTSQFLQLFVPPALIADFGTFLSGKTINFTDSSIGSIITYFWTFGDGTSSSDKNPVHTYSKTDTTYNVCLTIYDGSNCSYTFCKDVSLATSVSTVADKTNWSIYPDPVSNELFINAGELNRAIEGVEIYDVLGRLALNKNMGDKTSNPLQINVSILSEGMYFLKIKTLNADYVKKIVKQ